MVQSQYSLSWDSYKSSICSGFSALQQNGEFVDMTLAADGHLVKVHQVLMALSSPYIKELISSAPCPHPVIFLNNISHKVLSLLLEYIYTGEVLVPSENLTSFVETAKALCIKGLENIGPYDSSNVRLGTSTTQLEDGELCHVSGTKRMSVPTGQGMEQISLPAAARKILIKKQNTAKSLPDINVHEGNDYSEMDDTAGHDSDDAYAMDQPAAVSRPEKSTPSTNLQFTVSIRGSLQIILNRYLYNLNSTSSSGVRRWRCVDYRNNKCSAFVVTKGNLVINRANLHNHSFHDKKILTKIEKKSIFSAIDDVQAYKEKEATTEETSMEQDDYNASISYGDGSDGAQDKDK